MLFLDKILNMNSVKGKKKSNQLSKVVSDQDLQKHAQGSKKRVLTTSRSDLLESQKKRNMITMQDSKFSHNINLQIPSIYTPNSNSVISKQGNSKKSACIQGLSSKITIKSPKVLKNKKPHIQFDSKTVDNEGSAVNEDDHRLEELGNQVNLLKSELQNALIENKKLRKSLQNENSKEDLIDDAMNSFKSRLYKLLYD